MGRPSDTARKIRKTFFPPPGIPTKPIECPKCKHYAVAPAAGLSPFAVMCPNDHWVPLP